MNARLKAQTLATLSPTLWQMAAGGKKSFDVASVRKSSQDAPQGGNVMLDALDSTQPTGDRFTANASLVT
jgi:hypothetical protein